MRKVVEKQRNGAKVKKRYDQAKTPFDRLIEKGVLLPHKQEALIKKKASPESDGDASIFGNLVS
ncbi:hypothetical protein J2S00_002668 [Caldalkalibacillus uzonensis]|uniref:Uncharacterized protein n=1 Tax=Caldalkalibacillus uzonensis TaxID=353224 RepID=A0ABU0CU29_9BACI|nr:hypothetical protein [Caldalkalibacillus uzonensis]